jgi:predicted DCC family thiol-disulfide oxidoreductase YuxK
MTGIGRKVILFDGVCNFCNSSVNFIIDKDKHNVFRFASLQSDFGKKSLKDFNLPVDKLSTLILISDNRYFTKTTAALKIAKDLSFPYSLSYVFIIVPPFIRNVFYDLFARNRYKWFGKKDACRIPSASERAKFIE